MEPRKPPKVFATPAAFRAWLARHGQKETELWIFHPKVGSKAKGISHKAALDEALCYGWIDGQLRSLGPDAFTVRWTPRKKGSYWSKVNQRKVAALIAAGRMAPPGLAAFEARDPAHTERYSFEQMPRELPPKLEAELQRHARAWAFWEKQPPSYRKMVVAYLTSAKREETVARRLAALIERSDRGERLPQFAPAPRQARKAPKPTKPRAGAKRSARPKRSSPSK